MAFDDGKKMRDLLNEYQKRIEKLNLNSNSSLWSAATYNQAPHKPLLLLSVFDLYAQEIAPANLIKISSVLGQLFSAYWSIIFPGSKRQNARSYSLPFFHLSTEENSFWHLVPIPGNEAALTEALKVVKLAEAVRFSLNKLGKITLGARIDKQLHQLLFQEKYREELRRTIIEKYFSEEVHSSLYEQSKNNILLYGMQKSSHAMFMNGLTNTDISPSRSNSLRGQPVRELTNVNTQVRRLAYFPALLGSAARQNYNYNSLAMRLQSWGKDHQENLDAYFNQTGNVVPKRKPKKPRLPTDRASHAAKRYVDFAENIGWLNQISGLYAITRTGRVLLTAGEAVTLAAARDEEENPFELNDIQKLFFIAELWRKDGDVLFTLFKLLGLYPVPLKTLQEQFGAAYRQHLEDKTRLVSGERERRELRERINNIKTWTNPARYAEQFVPTRMNWLLDLGLVSISPKGRRECHLTSAGVNFKSRLPGTDALGDEWFNNLFFKSVAPYFVSGERDLCEWTSAAANKELLLDCLRSAFKHLRRPPVPKFSVSQTVFFVCLTMAVGDRVLIDYDDVLRELAAPVRIDKDYVVELRRAARENESYLILNPV